MPYFLDALALEDQRVGRGWAPFWHYRRLGRYGEQLRSLFGHFPREQVLVLRYRDLVDNPLETMVRVDRFLGVAPHVARVARPENVHPYVGDTLRVRALGGVIRAGARAGSVLPPQVWRSAERRLVGALHRGGGRRPALTPPERLAALDGLAADIAVLEELTGAAYSDWLGEVGAGDFSQRRVPHQRPAT